MYDVYVARLGGTTYAVRSNGRVIAKVPSGTDCSRLLKAAVASEKAKKEKKSEPPKAKKTAKKSK